MDEESELSREEMQTARSKLKQAQDRQRLDRLLSGIKELDPALFERFNVGKGRRAKLDQVQEVLVSALRDDTTSVRCNAARAIGRLAELGFGNEAFLTTLSNSFSAATEHDDLRKNLVKAIAKNAPKCLLGSADQLISALADPTPAVVAEAIAALVELGWVVAPSLDEQLLLLLEHPDVNVRVAACKGLGDLKPLAADVLPALIVAAVGKPKQRSQSSEETSHQIGSARTKKHDKRELSAGKAGTGTPLDATVSHAAIRAIESVDPMGTCLGLLVTDLDTRKRLMILLNRTGKVTSQLYRNLSTRWNALIPPQDNQRPSEGDISASPDSKQQPGIVRTKKSTAKGDARLKIIAALIQYHRYEGGICTNLEPIGVHALARKAKVGKSSVSRFFQNNFRGHNKYKMHCRDTTSLGMALKLLNQEFAPYVLFGRSPPGEAERSDEP
jgi:hypothetical protein